MEIWFLPAIIVTVLAAATFVYLVSRRKWTPGALAVGLQHFILATLGSVAPFRSFLDPEYAGLGLGLFRFEGQAAALPATLVLVWALASAYIPLLVSSGPFMFVVAAGDALWALNIGAAVLVSGDWTFQLGEFLLINGVAGLLVLWVFFTLPFLLAAVWAGSRVRSTGTPPPAVLARHDGASHVSDSDSEDADVRFSGASARTPGCLGRTQLLVNLAK